MRVVNVSDSNDLGEDDLEEGREGSECGGT
jgi:hypothetical protein